MAQLMEGRSDQIFVFLKLAELFHGASPVFFARGAARVKCAMQEFPAASQNFEALFQCGLFVHQGQDDMKPGKDRKSVV
jgi:hypothetical protein